MTHMVPDLVDLTGPPGRPPHDPSHQHPPVQPPVRPRLMKPKIPNIVVLTTPTTAVTRAGTAVLDLETGHRVELFDPKTRPAAVFLDTDALLTAPVWLCLSAAASCFSGVVGALQSPEQANPLAEGDLIQALGLLRRDMQLVKSQEESGRSRINLCAAAILMNRAMDSGAGRGARGVGRSGGPSQAIFRRTVRVAGKGQFPASPGFGLLPDELPTVRLPARPHSRHIG